MEEQWWEQGPLFLPLWPRIYSTAHRARGRLGITSAHPPTDRFPILGMPHSIAQAIALGPRKTQDAEARMPWPGLPAGPGDPGPSHPAPHHRAAFGLCLRTPRRSGFPGLCSGDGKAPSSPPFFFFERPLFLHWAEFPAGLNLLWAPGRSKARSLAYHFSTHATRACSITGFATFLFRKKGKAKFGLNYLLIYLLVCLFVCLFESKGC